MGVSKDFEAFVVDLFSDLGPVRFKRMFGAALAYCGDHAFALVDDETIWIKVDQVTEPQFEAVGSPRFTYPMRDGRSVDMAFRRLPDAAMDDPQEACAWARLGVQAAERKGVKAPRSRAKKARS